MIEGVTVSFKEIDEEHDDNELCNENDLINRVNEIVNGNPNKQITFNYYISNIERILNIIKTNTRKVVLDAYYSYVLKEATNYQSYYYNLDGKDYGLDPKYEIKFEDLLNDKNKYMWQLGTHALKEFNKLERDVEVLDILKGYFSSTENGQWYIEMYESDFDFKSECTKEEWENSPQKKIKDWLCSGGYLK